MNQFTKKIALAVAACACVGTFNSYCDAADVNDQAPAVATTQTQAEPMVGMPSPIKEYNSIADAAKAVGITPQLPRLLPVGFAPVGVTTISDQTLQVAYGVQVGDAATIINYRVAKGSDDISGDYNQYENVITKKVNGTKVTFKGNKDLVKLATWVKDGQTHAMYFEIPVTQDMAKSIVENVRA